MYVECLKVTATIPRTGDSAACAFRGQGGIVLVSRVFFPHVCRARKGRSSSGSTYLTTNTCFNRWHNAAWRGGVGYMTFLKRTFLWSIVFYGMRLDSLCAWCGFVSARRTCKYPRRFYFESRQGRRIRAKRAYSVESTYNAEIILQDQPTGLTPRFSLSIYQPRASILRAFTEVMERCV